MTPGRTGTCCATRHLTRNITPGSIPPRLSAAHRQQCLWDLKDIGYQVGTGFMVGSPLPDAGAPGRGSCCLSKKLQPQMVGIGPFIPHHDTPFAGRACRNAGADLVHAGTDPAAASQGAAPRHHRSWHHCPGRAGTGHPGRSKRSHAKPFPHSRCGKSICSTTTKSVPDEEAAEGPECLERQHGRPSVTAW